MSAENDFLTEKIEFLSREIDFAGQKMEFHGREDRADCTLAETEPADRVPAETSEPSLSK